MKPGSLPALRCPVCRGALALATAEGDAERVLEGTLSCTACRAEYPIRRGMPNLLPLTERGQYAKAEEMQGWVSLWAEKGMYERPNYESSLQAPYLPGDWHNVAVLFDLAQREIGLQGGETVLDLAAGFGWAARRFAERGCTVFAVDIVADEVYGLGRAWALMEHAGVYFEPLLADGETLPFPDGSFDLVFICGGLHHFVRFGPVLAEIKRVLKPGGRFVATGEPALSLMERERDAQRAMEETRVGIVERRPKSFNYWWELRRAGFVDVMVDSPDTYRIPPAQTRARLREARQSATARIRPRYRHLALLALTLLQAAPQRLVDFVLLGAQGGLLLIRGRKPPGPRGRGSV
jgi:SAM-dependent methyltransferase